MKYFSILFVLALFTLHSCNLDFLDCYDGDFINKEIIIDEVNTVEIDFPCEIVLIDGPVQSIKVNAKEDLISDLEDKSTVSGKTWKVRLENNCIKHREDITFTMTIPGLKRIEVDGSTVISGDSGLSMLDEIFELDFDGSADVRLSDIHVKEFSVRSDGSIDLSLQGSTVYATFDFDGSGKISARNFRTANTTLRMDGSGFAEIWVTDKLNVNLDGSASVCLKGNPSVTSQIDGSGKIQNCN